MVGGYKIIDLKGEDFTVGVGKTIPGIYDAIEESRKPILLENYSIAGVDRLPRFISIGVSAGSTDFHSVIGIDKTVNLLNITITEDDLVTFTEN